MVNVAERQDEDRELFFGFRRRCRSLETLMRAIPVGY